MTLIYTYFDDKSYLYSNDQANSDNSLYVPLNVDTEFYNRQLDNPLLRHNPSSTITVQVRGVNEPMGKIYSHLDCQDIARHPLFNESFIGFQYLKDNGYFLIYKYPKVITHKLGSSIPTLPKIHFHLYAHFACADLIRLFYADYQKDVRELILNAKGTGNNQGITQNRRLQTYFRGKGGYKNHCYLNWIVEYQGIQYQVVLTVFDTIAIAGTMSYGDLAKLVGFDLPYKDSLDKKDKKDMINTYLNNENFDNYALGDLYSYELLLGFDNQYKHLLQEMLGINDDEKLTSRLTIGSSMARILSHLLKSKFNDKKLFSELTKNANSDYLRKLQDTRAILSKVDGGRCYNNRPLDTIVEKNGDYQTLSDLAKGLDILCDIDMVGAYSRGLALQDYPIGNPRTLKNEFDDNNKYPTLREFLDKGYESKHGFKVKGVRDQLVDGLWIMRVSTIKPLKYSQDLIASWIIDPKKIDRLTDPVQDDLSVDYPKEGHCKIFTNEITLGLINIDILQWIDNICSRDQKNELYDNLQVINAMWYEKDDELKTVKEVEEKFLSFNGQSESFNINENEIHIRERCRYWTRINLGDLLIKRLIQEREKYPKNTHKKENEFYKLCINTTYGILVSKFFDISNTVVGNNITARCRVMMWYLEKGLNGFQSITDGCLFELDNVAYPISGKRLTANNLVKGYEKTIRDRQWKTDKLNIGIYLETLVDDKYIHRELITEDNQPIDAIELNNFIKDNILGFDENGKTILPLEVYQIALAKGRELERKYFSENAKNQGTVISIEDDILNHLRYLFPKVDILHKTILNIDGFEQIGYFTLEIKCYAKKAIFHGNANYYLENIFSSDFKTCDINPLIKMRGYIKDSFIFENDDDLDYLNDDNEQSWLEYLLSDLDENEMLTEDINLLDVNVPKNFFNSLKIDLTRVPRQSYFLVDKIIKCKDYKNNYKTYKNYNVDIGYSIPQIKLLTELVLSQFTYPNQETYQRWIDNHYSHKSKYGHGYESCFLNDDDSLNYQLMIETINQKISTGKKLKLKPIEHPNYQNKENRNQDIQNRFLRE